MGPVTQWRCLSCETPEGFAGGALCRRCEADEADAAIETLRVMLMDEAARMAGEVAAARLVKRAAPGYYDGWLPGHERRACVAIALALLL